MTLDAHVHLESATWLGNFSESASELGTVLLACARALATGGARTAYLRFNPVRWGQRGVPAVRQLQDLARAREDALRDHAIDLAYFVTLKRDGTPSGWESAVDFALAGRDRHVLGVDVSRSYDVTDTTPPPWTDPDRSLVDQLRRARDGGLVIAMHCGWHERRAELEMALSVGATRIGHGTPLRDAPDLDADLAARDVAIEVCPTAFERRAGAPVAVLPVDRWIDAGIRVDVGSDHPVAFGTSTRAEHDRLARAFPRWAALPDAGTRHG